MKRKMILLAMLLLLGFGYSNAQYGPVVSFTYDDGFSNWYDIGFPIFQEYGFPGVVYINATNSWASGNIDKLLEMQAAGWEISNHTYSHDCSYGESQVSTMKDWLNANGFPNSGFGAPCNIWDHARVNFVKKHSSYLTTATELPGIPQPIDLYFVQRINLTNRDNIAAVRGWLDDAVANNKWIVFLAHEFGGTYGDGSTWFQSEQLLRLVFDEIVLRGIPVKTVREVINDQFPTGRFIECSADSMQYPVLTYLEQQGQGDPLPLNTSVWNEYWHNTSWTGPRYKGSPVVYCHTSNDSLPVMKFYRNVPNGEYEVVASILEYDPGRTYRLYYSFDSTNTSQYNVEVNKNSDVSLGTVTVTDGQFALYTQNADAISGGDGFVGWAFIKLITQASANVKVFLEGGYSDGTMTTSLNSSGMIPFHHPYNDTLGIWNYTGSERIYNLPTDIVDWVLVELRTGTEANTTVGRRAALLKSDGSIVDLDGTSQVRFRGITPGNYYIVIRHRNHLPIMSANPISLSSTNSLLYDFTTGQSQAYGTEPMINLGGSVFGMYAGDANTSTIISAADVTPIIANLNLADYKNADVNMSGIVTAADVTKIISNLNKGTNVPD